MSMGASEDSPGLRSAYENAPDVESRRILFRQGGSPRMTSLSPFTFLLSIVEVYHEEEAPAPRRHGTV